MKKIAYLIAACLVAMPVMAHDSDHAQPPKAPEPPARHLPAIPGKKHEPMHEPKPEKHPKQKPSPKPENRPEAQKPQPAPNPHQPEKRPGDAPEHR